MNQLSIRKNNLQTKKKKKGFTLVELIIVIAIIAILAAIAIPKFGTIKGDANKKTDIATAKNIATIVSKDIASDTIKDTFTSTVVTALPNKTGTGVTDITTELDGKVTATSGNSFYVVATSGNIKIYDGSTTDTAHQLFPQT